MTHKYGNRGVFVCGYVYFLVPSVRKNLAVRTA